MDTYSTTELQEMVRIVQPQEQFLLSMFFADERTFDTETISFDVKKTKRKLAPFVSPCTAGKPNKREGFSTEFFKPPYVKPKDMLKPTDSVKRVAGEAIGGSLSPQARIDQALGEILADHASQVDSRLEWMAAQVLVTGAFTVTGEDVPEQEINYGRAAGHTTASTNWDDVNTDIIADIELKSGTVLDAVGVGVSDMIVDTITWGYLRKNTGIKELLDIRHGGMEDLNLAPEVGAKTYFKGMLGNIRVWVYNDTYVDENDVAQKFIPDNSCILIANGDKGLAGYQAFGAIQDFDALAPMPIFTKMYKENDPSGMCVLSQSAGIVIASRIDATLYIDTTPSV